MTEVRDRNGTALILGCPTDYGHDTLAVVGTAGEMYDFVDATEFLPRVPGPGLWAYRSTRFEGHNGLGDDIELSIAGTWHPAEAEDFAAVGMTVATVDAHVAEYLEDADLQVESVEGIAFGQSKIAAEWLDASSNSTLDSIA